MTTFQGCPLDIWSINLNERSDRAEHARHELAKAGLEARRFSAFRPDEWSGEPKKIARMMARTPGAVGCWMSQVHAVRTVQDTNRHVWITEDDCCFCEDIQGRLAYLESHLTWPWDIIWMGATFHVPGVWCKHAECSGWGDIGRDIIPTSDPHILRSPGIWSTYSWIVNGHKVRTVLDALDEIMPMSDGIDHAFLRLGLRLNTFCFVPGCCWQIDSQSNIGTGITKFSGFKTLGPYAWTDRMEDFDPTCFNWEKGIPID